MNQAGSLRGSIQTFTATGTFSDNSTQTLASVTWTTSDNTIATVTNDVSNHGNAFAVATGAATITACAGSICGSRTLTVGSATASLVSIALTPTNPTIGIGSSQVLNLTATGTYSDSTTKDLTSTVTWASSNTSVAAVFDISGPAVVVPVAPGSTNVTATLGSISGSTTVTVNMPLVPAPPIITGVSPAGGTAGAQVTVTGSAFGPSQGSGGVWLGTALGTVVSWSDSQVVATVSAGSSSGVAQILQSNGASNSVPFTINTATIITASPNNGLAGTQVTISGSGFGAAQGNGNVWLGTAPAVVNDWSDSQVVATVAAGAATGSAQVLQNGVMSNAVPFTINVPHITGISPNGGAAGTLVTVTGSGFGATQGNGTVWIGNTYGVVAGWSDTQVVAAVGSNAVSGIVKVEQDGLWSNTVTFTVPSGSGGGGGGGGGSATAVALVPNVINMVVGGTQSIEAVDSNGQSLTGLQWISSNNTVATLSTDDPPIITAVGPGNVTITAGNASADVTVWTGATLPTGTVIWSNPGDGSGVSSIVAAVPSSTGVADVFALQADGNVQAIKADGTTGWTANVGTTSTVIPDFQGGLIVYTGSSIYKLDGLTGHAYPTYTAAPDHVISTPLIHTDGTVFTLDSYTVSESSSGASSSSNLTTNYHSVIAIDPLTGQPKFSVAMEPTSTSTTSAIWDVGYCGDSVRRPPLATSAGRAVPVRASGNASFSAASTAPDWGMIAGDGYVYAFNLWGTLTTVSIITGGKYDCVEVSNGMQQQYLSLLRLSTGGDAAEVGVANAELVSANNFFAGTTLSTGNLITNADLGALATYEIDTCTDPNCASPSKAFLLATTSGTGLASNVEATSIPGQQYPVQPVLQREDGNFVGTVSSSAGNFMLGFTPSGGTLFTVPNDSPQIGTSDDGVITASGTTYDQNGNITGQGALPGTPSWHGFLYSVSGDPDVQHTVPPALFLQADLLRSAGGNVSRTLTSLNLPEDPWSLRLVPTSDTGKQKIPREIVYTLTRLDGKKSPKGIWYVTEHQKNFCLADCSDGMSGGIDDPDPTITDKNQFPDTVGCQNLANCLPMNSLQTFTISTRTGECRPPSFGDPQATPCKTFGGTIVVRSPHGSEYGTLGIYFDSNSVLINGHYDWSQD